MSGMGQLTPSKSLVPASPYVIFEGGGCVFSFTLRVADGVELGMEVCHLDGGDALHVKGVKPGGAIEAWNKQCVGGPAAGKAVSIGDKIVSVNDFCKPQEMLRECREKKMLRLSVSRGVGDPNCDVMAALMAGRARHNSGPAAFAPTGFQGAAAGGSAAAAALASAFSPLPKLPGSPLPKLPGSPLRADADDFTPSAAPDA